MKVKTTSNRLFFIDAMRAWAILMMLQGHFIDGLLDPVFRDSSSMAYNIWLYFRGITAPVFFTVSGFIFTYLLLRVPQTGWENPRVKKGIKRGLQLLLIGYLLRLNLFGLFQGKLYDAFFLVDVLHCIGLSILSIIGIYLLSSNKKGVVFPALLLGLTVVLFMFEPLYKQWTFGFLPQGLANYFTKANGSVFTIIPWLGYATIGGAISILFRRLKDIKNFYWYAIPAAFTVGALLILQSSNFFLWMYESTGLELFRLIPQNNYLFIRLGDVFIVFALFMVFRNLLTHSKILKVGSSTLSIYVIHFIILYGSFTGLGLYRFFHHALSPTLAITGALAFMVLCTFLALQYGKHEVAIKLQLTETKSTLGYHIKSGISQLSPILRTLQLKIRSLAYRLFGFNRS